MVKNKEFFSLYVPITAYAIYQSLSSDDRIKLCALLENEFTYLVNCLVADKVDNGLIFGYTTLQKFLKEREGKL